MQRLPLALLGSLLLVTARDVRADAFVAPEGKRAVPVSIGLEGLDAHPKYSFVVSPNACYPNADDPVGYSVVRGPDSVVDRSDYVPEQGSCAGRRVYALPVDLFPPSADGELLSLVDEAKSVLVDRENRRVLSAEIEGEDAWWVPDALPLIDIVDIHRVELSGESLRLVPARVRFDFGEGRVIERAFYQGKRPRIPREEEIPPPSEIPPPPPGSEPAPAPAPAQPAPPPVAAPAPAPAQPDPPPVQEPSDMSRKTWPIQLVLGGACLVVALAAGLVLRRRR